MKSAKIKKKIYQIKPVCGMGNTSPQMIAPNHVVGVDKHHLTVNV
jgi:hypothetical protein